MESQWSYVLQNLGEWQGSFTHLSPAGEVMKDIPSLISLEGVNQNQTIHLVLKRFYPIPGSAELHPKELVMDFSAMGSGALCFENGAFSEGKMYFSPGLPFVAEFCLLNGGQGNLAQGNLAQRRSRLVQIFNAASQLNQITLIREQRLGSDAPERPPLVLEDLLGEWQGDAVTRYPNDATPKTHSTAFTLLHESATQLIQKLSSQDTMHKALPHGSRIFFNDHEQPYQTLLLPDGAFSTCPLQIRSGQPFFLEAGWLTGPGIRQRLIRHYNSEGNWISVIWINEQRNQ